MNQSIAQIMNSRAHFVAGRHAWERSNTDPFAEISVKEAQVFLKDVEKEMGVPNVSGGTSSKPEDILTLYWTVKGINKIIGVYVTFNGDHTCNVSWNKSDGSLQRISRLPVGELSNLDMPQKFRELSNYKFNNEIPPNP